jgi:protein TonB
MTNKEILHANLLDILFEHRNKTYGAYALRKNYNSRLIIALAIALFVVLLSVLFSFMKNNNRGNSSVTGSADSVVLKTFNIPPDPEEPKEKPKKKIKTIRSLDRIQIVPDNIPVDVPEQDNLIDAVIGKENTDGIPLDDPNKIVKPDSENGDGKSVLEKEPGTDFFPKEIPPFFPGGISAWLNFLRRYLQTPDELEAGQKVEVRVRFWIDTDGSVSRFDILQSGGNAFDKEVLRVMKKMPRWEPAMQNNNKVAVAYTQPVIFVGVEE